MDQARLKELLHYDPETGVFTNLVSRGKALAGGIAGYIRPDGYRQVRLGMERYYAHRLAFLYMDGAMPPDHVDHINGNTADNSWGNLRLASRAVNTKNTKRRRTNISGVTGVRWAEARRKWRAWVTVDGVEHRLYYGDNPFMAVYLRAKAAHDCGFHLNHGRG